MKPPIVQLAVSAAILTAVWLAGCSGETQGISMLRVTAYVEDPLVASVHIVVPDIVDYGITPVVENPGQPRQAATGSPVPAGIMISVSVDAIDAQGHILGDAYVVQVQTGNDGSTTYVYIQLPYYAGGGSGTGIGAVTNHPPVLDPPSIGTHPQTGQVVNVSLNATDQDPGDTLTYFTMVVAGNATLGDGTPTFAFLGNEVAVTPNDANPVMLMTGVVDSKQRADLWHLSLDPSSGAFAVEDHLTGYAFAMIQSPAVDLIVLDTTDDTGAPMIETLADVNADHSLGADAILRWRNATIASANVYANDGSSVLVRADILDGTAIDRQIIAIAPGDELLGYATSTLESGTLPLPIVDTVTFTSPAVTLAGQALSGTSAVYLEAADGTLTACSFDVNSDTAVTAQVPAGFPSGTYHAVLMTYGVRSASSPPFSIM